MSYKFPGHPLGRKIETWFACIAIKLISRLEITGIDNIPPTGPIVVIINHISYLDPILVCITFPRTIIPIAKQEAFNLFPDGLLMKIYGTIPIHRGRTDIAAIKSALHVLKNGGTILVAPEGTRSPNYQMQTGKNGAVMLALRSKAIIMPIGIIDTHLGKTHWLKLKRAPIRLSVGKPFRLRQSSTNNISKKEMAVMTNEVMYKLAAQLPSELRGVYYDLKKATDSYLIPL